VWQRPQTLAGTLCTAGALCSPGGAAPLPFGFASAGATTDTARTTKNVATASQGDTVNPIPWWTASTAGRLRCVHAFRRQGSLQYRRLGLLVANKPPQLPQARSSSGLRLAAR
jgi:hypothetical protein